MTVVLFCGGLGTRIEDHAGDLPKPMVRIGRWPILLHLMTYYAHYGHREFVLCLGHRGEVIERYFRSSARRVGSPMRAGRATQVSLATARAGRWTVTLVPTGARASVGQRLRAAKPYVRDGMFLANYADGLSDLDLPDYLGRFRKAGTVAALLCVRPTATFHVLRRRSTGLVERIDSAREALWINGGFFAFRREIFEYLEPGDDLVGPPLRRLIARRQLTAFEHHGFWACMDTFRDKQLLDALDARGRSPWKVWRRTGPSPAARAGRQAPQRALRIAHEVHGLLEQRARG